MKAIIFTSCILIVFVFVYYISDKKKDEKYYKINSYKEVFKAYIFIVACIFPIALITYLLNGSIEATSTVSIFLLAIATYSLINGLMNVYHIKKRNPKGYTGRQTESKQGK